MIPQIRRQLLLACTTMSTMTGGDTFIKFCSRFLFRNAKVLWWPLCVCDDDVRAAQSQVRFHRPAIGAEAAIFNTAEDTRRKRALV